MAYTVGLMHVVREYNGWDPAEPLEDEAAALLAFLDELEPEGPLVGIGEVVATIDGYGVVCVDVPLGRSGFFIQVGDGWDRFVWEAPSGRAHEWGWDEVAGPRQLRALLDGRGAERVTYIGRRRLALELTVDGEVIASSGGLLGRRLARLGTSLDVREEPAL